MGTPSALYLSLSFSALKISSYLTIFYVWTIVVVVIVAVGAHRLMAVFTIFIAVGEPDDAMMIVLRAWFVAFVAVRLVVVVIVVGVVVGVAVEGSGLCGPTLGDALALVVWPTLVVVLHRVVVLLLLVAVELLL